MVAVDWYFDFISPYAYLAFKRLDALPEDLEVRPCPVLFAGLLGHWRQKGPAEIPAKRRQTYLQVAWRARRYGIAMRPPPRHPFNPLALLRLAIALGTTRPVISTIFDHVWRDGEAGDTPDSLARLAAKLGVADLEARIADPAVKAALRRNGEQAIAASVYGVPTFDLAGELFWGEDAVPMMLDVLADRGLFETSYYRGFAEIAPGPERGLPLSSDPR